jgi:thioester reductase-like protein
LYQHSTIQALSEALLKSQGSEGSINEMEQRYQETQDLAVKYIEKATRDFSVATTTAVQEKVVLLTGATGSIGSSILSNLLQDASVKKVYCLVRGASDRLVNAFNSRFLDSSLLDTERLEVLPMKLNEKFLGFTQEKYNQLQNEVTIVQHCAWLLDFNMPVDYYDKECIAPFYNLLTFAYRPENPMHVHFISSVSASAALGAEVLEEPLPLDAHVAMPMGYAQSKFVVEVLLNYLTIEKNFPCYIERVGQVCGDSVHGVWNTTEQYPLMFVGGGSMLRKMPALDSTIDWIPVDYAAKSITDIMLQTADLPADITQSIYHIVNPTSIAWSDVLDTMKEAGMEFEIVSASEWVDAVSQDSTNPCYRLISFYESNFSESLQMPTWKTDKTRQVSTSINSSPVLDLDLFKKYLNHWQSVDFYNP